MLHGLGFLAAFLRIGAHQAEHLLVLFHCEKNRMCGMHHQAAPVTPVHVPRQPRMVIASIWKTSFGITSEKGAGVAICADFF